MTSWRRAEAGLAAGGLACGLALAGCGAPRKAEPPPVPPPAPEEAAAPATPAARPPAGGAGAGLVPLPSRTQVVGAVPLGRRDPFGEVIPRPVAATSGRASAPPAAPPPPPPSLPEGFRLAGVMRSGGRSAAVVQLGQRSESLRPGDLGGLSSELLPPGWRVAGIDVDRGSLTLLRGAQRLVVDL